jgi:hypothetical protein
VDRVRSRRADEFLYWPIGNVVLSSPFIQTCPPGVVPVRLVVAATLLLTYLRARQCPATDGDGAQGE